MSAMMIHQGRMLVDADLVRLPMWLHVIKDLMEQRIALKSNVYISIGKLLWHQVSARWLWWWRFVLFKLCTFWAVWPCWCQYGQTKVTGAGAYICKTSNWTLARRFVNSECIIVVLYGSVFFSTQIQNVQIWLTKTKRKTFTIENQCDLTEKKWQQKTRFNFNRWNIQTRLQP